METEKNTKLKEDNAHSPTDSAAAEAAAAAVSNIILWALWVAIEVFLSIRDKPTYTMSALQIFFLHHASVYEHDVIVMTSDLNTQYDIICVFLAELL